MNITKAFWFLLFSARVAVIHFSADLETAFVAHHDCWPCIPNLLSKPSVVFSKFLQVYRVFSVRRSARLLLAQLLPFIHLSDWFIPLHSELCSKHNTELLQLCLLNCLFSSPFNYIFQIICHLIIVSLLSTCAKSSLKCVSLSEADNWDGLQWHTAKAAWDTQPFPS